MTGPIAAPDGALQTHAASLDWVADQVETSRAAAAATHLDRGAYGLMCQFMPDYFEPGMRDTVDGLATSVAELRRLAMGLRSQTMMYGRVTDSSIARTTNAGASIRLPL